MSVDFIKLLHSCFSDEKYGRTSLTHAAELGHEEIVEYLLRSNANVNGLKTLDTITDDWNVSTLVVQHSRWCNNTSQFSVYYTICTYILYTKLLVEKVSKLCVPTCLFCKLGRMCVCVCVHACVRACVCVTVKNR